MSVKHKKAGSKLYEIIVEFGWTKVRASEILGTFENMVYKYCKMDTFSDSILKKKMVRLKEHGINPDYFNDSKQPKHLADLEKEPPDELAQLRKDNAELRFTMEQIGEEMQKQTELIRQIMESVLTPNT